MMRTVQVSLVLVAATTAACLSTPSPAVDATAAPSECGQGVRPTPQPWPPADAAVRVIRVADVNLDDRDDLVIEVAPATIGDPSPSQIHVMYGPLPIAGPYQSDVVVDVGALAEISPHGVRVQDLTGDECPELVVAGPPRQDGGPNYLAIWTHDGTSEPWTGEPVRQTLQLRLQETGDDALFEWADLSAETGPDLVVATTTGVMDLFIAPTPDDIPPPLSVPQPASCGWGYVMDLRAAPAAGAGDRIVGFGFKRWNVLTLDDVGSPVVSDNCVDRDGWQTLGGAPADLDGVPPMDVLTGGGGEIGAELIAGTDEPVTVTDALDGCSGSGPDFYSEGHAVGDMGGTSAIDVVSIDWNNNPAPDPLADRSFICLAESVAATAASVTASSVNERDLGPGRVQSVTIGDLTERAGAEAWVIEPDGDLRCFQRGSSPLLEPCE